jgi:hypothetical protein
MHIQATWRREVLRVNLWIGQGLTVKRSLRSGIEQHSDHARHTDVVLDRIFTLRQFANFERQGITPQRTS